MTSILNPEIAKYIHHIYYRYRFLFIYVIIGVLSILIEIQIKILLMGLSISEPFCIIFSIFVGIISAFMGNIDE